MTTQNLRLLDVDQLADECANHTERFLNRLEYDPSYCYELFRRAIVDRNDYAWKKIYGQYEGLVARWVRSHPKLPAAREQVKYLVNRTFDKLWSSVDAAKFAQFDNLQGLLRYLQICVNSVVVDHCREQLIETISLEHQSHSPSPDLSAIERQVAERAERRHLWQIVMEEAHNKKESIVLQLSFLCGLKPAQIYAEYPDLFESVEEVYQVKRNCLNRLRRNPAMKRLRKCQSGDSGISE